MNTLRRIERRLVVEAYVSYDAAKKGSPTPDMSNWDWTRADAIDAALRASGFKFGVPAGFTEWAQVSLTLDDLRKCAVVVSISRELRSAARDLGTLEGSGKLESWKPKTPGPSWLPLIEAGHPLPGNEPLLLRPATAAEVPARWYLEDGSGRATAIVANARRFDQAAVVAAGYLGSVVDKSSTFMRERFAELLPSGARN